VPTVSKPARSVRPQARAHTDTLSADVKKLRERFLERLQHMQGRSLISATRNDLYLALAYLVRDELVSRAVDSFDTFVARGGRLARIAQRLANVPASFSAGMRSALDHVRRNDPALAGALVFWLCNIGTLWASFHAFGHAPSLAMGGTAGRRRAQVVTGGQRAAPSLCRERGRGRAGAGGDGRHDLGAGAAARVAVEQMQMAMGDAGGRRRARAVTGGQRAAAPR